MFSRRAARYCLELDYVQARTDGISTDSSGVQCLWQPRVLHLIESGHGVGGGRSVSDFTYRFDHVADARRLIRHTLRSIITRANCATHTTANLALAAPVRSLSCVVLRLRSTLYFA